ncbi:MAG: hypothetical protein FJ271_06640 [Planctomycetes bacterium]|nr:hypothetical protein [Planctomycetota bacterium]
MNDVCRNVLEQIELYAAGECAEPARTEIAQHLAACPGCARSERESALLLGLLQARFEEPERLQRLHARLLSERRPSARTRVLGFAGRAAAVAALVLLAFGLTLGFRSFSTPEGEASLQIALAPAQSRLAQPGPAKAFAEKVHVGGPLIYTLDMKGKTGAEYRQALRDAMLGGQPPAPPAVNLQLTLRNRGEHALRILVGAENTALTLRLAGPGALTLRAKDPLGAAFLDSRTVRLAPGKSAVLPIERLVYGSRNHIQYAYWTEPGEYTLSIRYRAEIAARDARERTVWVQSEPIRILVQTAR